MKKYQVVILILLISAIDLFSQESGWEITDRIKNQKLALKDLVDVCVSPDSNYIYTAHFYFNYSKDIFTTYLYKWDINQGEFIDSTVLQSYIPAIFSSDNSFLLLYSNGIYNSDTINLNIFIYDIDKKNIIKQGLFSTPGTVTFKHNQKFQYYKWMNFNKFNYDQKQNSVYLSLFYPASSYEDYGGGYSGVSFYHKLGGSGLFKFEADNLSLIQQYSWDMVLSNISINDKIIMSTTEGNHSSSSTGSAYQKRAYFYNFLKSYSENQFDTIMKDRYELSISYGTGRPYNSWSKGDSNAFKYLVHNKDKNKLVATYSNKLLYFDVDFWNLKDSLISDSAFKLASFCNEGRYILNIVHDSLIIINVTDKFVDETIKLPFAPNKIKLLQNDANLMIFNENGNFAMVNLPKCFNLQQIIDPDTTVIPLDTIVKLIRNYDRDQIELNQEKLKDLANSQIQILDILGKTVLTINADMLKSNPIIDISNLKSGIYFIKYKDGVVKIIK